VDMARSGRRYRPAVFRLHLGASRRAGDSPGRHSRDLGVRLVGVVAPQRSGLRGGRPQGQRHRAACHGGCVRRRDHGHGAGAGRAERVMGTVAGCRDLRRHNGGLRRAGRWAGGVLAGLAGRRRGRRAASDLVGPLLLRRDLHRVRRAGHPRLVELEPLRQACRRAQPYGGIQLRTVAQRRVA
jgi:hypothetical protein